MTLLLTSLGVFAYLTTCCFIHASLKSRRPKGVLDFLKMVTLPIVVFNLIKDKGYYKETNYDI